MRRQSGEQARKRCFASAVLLGAAFVALEVDGQAAGQPRLSVVGYGNLPLSFEANQGQSEERVKFLARGQGYSLFLTPTEAVLSLRAPAQHTPSAAEHAATGKRAEPDEPAQPAAVVRMRLVGANKHPQLTGLDPLPGTSNYFIGGDPARWQRDVPNYARVKYAGVYPGIDLVYHGNQRQLEYDIVVAPDADPRRIAFAFEGVQKLSLDPEGNLVLQTAQGAIAQHKPVIYQDIGGTRQMVDGRYVLRAKHRVGFHVARYDTTRPLVIDPVLSYSTYLGGNGNDIGYAIAVDSAGSAYVTGLTNSTNFPTTGPLQATWAGSNDVFVTKLNAAGNALVYSTYLGGSGGEIGYAIAVDSTGNAYVTGETDSSTVTNGFIPFPTVGAFQPSYNGGGDAFVTKINASGNALVYSTYLGGGGTERGYGIAVDGSGNAYVTGHTSTSNIYNPNSPFNFPTVAAFQSQNGSPGTFDAFVTKINAVGALVYSTFLGGNHSEYSLDGGAIAVDSDGNAYVGGTTASTNFPGASTSTIQPTFGGVITGRSDGFVVKFNAAGSALIYSTYLGGTTDDAVNGIAVDTARNAYVVGYTDSPNDFPTAGLPFQPSKGGVGEDAFVAKINAAGSALVYSTYLGGSNGERAYGVAVDRGGNAYVSGWTTSSDFPTVAPVQAQIGGSGDAFISKLNAAGSALVYSTYLGGTGVEHGYGIAVDSAGNAYVTGDTNSTNFPGASTSTIQPTFSGAGTDAFVAKIVMYEAATFHPLASPCRAVDTRSPSGYPISGGTMAGGESRSFVVPSSSCGIPSNALAYSLNATVVPTGPLGYLTMWPSGQTKPLVSTLNSPDGRIKANAAIVPAGTGGAVSAYVTDSTDLILDIDGYFVPAGSGGDLAFYPLSPCRISDTRNAPGPNGGPMMQGGQTRAIPTWNVCSIPSSAQALSLNFTVVPQGPLSYLTTWPTGQTQPLVSTLNAPTGTVVANAAIVLTGASGQISVYVTNPTDVIVDVNGYFAPAGSPGALSFYAATPCRISDTRLPAGPFGGPEMASGETRSYAVPASSCSIPSSAQAYSLNATVVPSGGLGYLTLWPTGISQPTVSTLNAQDGAQTSNAAIVPAGTSGAIDAFVTSPTHLILDINGYFAP